jgi:hypothetical protein
MAGALAAVDVEDFAGHEAGPFEVEDRIDDVGNLAQPADWVQVASCAYSDGMHWRLDGARRHRVHSDPALGILDRKRFRRGIQATLRQRRSTAGQLIPRAEAGLRQIGANAPLAVKFVLDAVNKGLDGTQDQGLLIEASLFGLCAATEDKAEGTSAFLAKRAPNFHGR